MKKSIMTKGLVKKTQKEINEEGTVNLTLKIITLMSKHIGKKNAISRRNLFKHFFGEPENYNHYEQIFYWGKLSSIINYIKRKTFCFIVGEQRQTDYYFFVIKNQEDANIYMSQADNRIEGLKEMKKRAQKAVNKKLYLKVQKVAKQYSLNNKKRIQLN